MAELLKNRVPRQQVLAREKRFVSELLSLERGNGRENQAEGIIIAVRRALKNRDNEAVFLEAMDIFVKLPDQKKAGIVRKVFAGIADLGGERAKLAVQDGIYEFYRECQDEKLKAA